MANYSMKLQGRRKRIGRRLLLLAAILAVLIIGGIVVARRVYDNGLKAVSTSQQSQVITIASGATSSQIATQLAAKHLIRSAWAFELYVHSKELGSKLQAGTYAFSPSEGTASIIATLTRGAVTTNLVTILPGRRLDQVRSDLINDGFTPAAVDKALDPAQYADLPALAYKPAGASLEGLLYPDSFQRTADTDPSVIVRESLVEMGTELNPTLQAAFASENLTTYQGLILASIVEKEVSRATDRAQAAQVFMKRYTAGTTLGSDVTAYYGAILAGKTPSVTYDSAYNTRLRTGFPPTPISTVSAGSLQAAAHPANTDWLFFVAGDDGITYFSNTQAEQDANAAKYCHKLCSE
jgi:UPF0755 protein